MEALERQCRHRRVRHAWLARAARFDGSWWIVALVILAFGCASSSGKKSPEAAPAALSVEEAQRIVDAERAKAGGAPTSAPPPESLTDVLLILRRDETDRYAPARDYLSGLSGVEALSTQATLEMLWSEGALTVAELARERVKRKEAEQVTLQQQLELQPKDTVLTALLHEAQREAERERRLCEALETLARAHNEVGMTLAKEVVRRDPERADGYSVLANLYRLRGDWSLFQSNIEKAEARAPEGLGVIYARVMERAGRLADREGAREGLEDLIAQHPDLARAQAQLVLLQDDATARHDELEKLKLINPRHALIVLEGKGIEREYQNAKEVSAVRPDR